MTGKGAVHVTTQRRHYIGKDGRERVYETHLLRRSWREGGKVRNETVANLSRLPPETIELIRASLAGQRFVPAGQQAQVARSLPHGHAAAVHAAARKLGLPALLGPACRERDLAFALVISWVLRPASKLSTIGWWGDVTLGADLGVVGASADEVYAAMDWLTARQDGIERQLGRRHLRDGGIAMFDAFGYSQDSKKGEKQIEYGLLTDPDGRPVAARVFSRNTGDPKTFHEVADVGHGTFGLQQVIMVGDRGMITSARITELRKIEGMAWITCLPGPAIRKLMDDGSLRLSLFDEQDLAEITCSEFPGERLIACRNPVLATERINAEAATDKIYVIRTAVSVATLDAAGTVTACKRLSRLGRDFGPIKADDLDRVKAHVLICMLACYLTWHLRQAWAPLTSAKASRKTGPGNQPIRSFRDIIDHLATLTRNDLRYGQAVVPVLAEPTPTQQRAFDLIGAPIPLTLTT
jgi:hypothetical protein